MDPGQSCQLSCTAHRGFDATKASISSVFSRGCTVQVAYTSRPWGFSNGSKPLRSWCCSSTKPSIEAGSIRQRASAWRARVPRPEQGGIHKDAIKAAKQLRLLLRPGGGIAMAHLDAAQPQALGIAAHPPQACFAAIQREHKALISHQLGQVRALAARGCAGIQDALTRLGIQQRCNALTCSILHAPMTFRITGQPAEVTAAAQQGEARRQPLDRLGLNPGGRELRLHRRHRAAQHVHP